MIHFLIKTSTIPIQVSEILVLIKLYKYQEHIEVGDMIIKPEQLKELRQGMGSGGLPTEPMIQLPNKTLLPKTVSSDSSVDLTNYNK